MEILLLHSLVFSLSLALIPALDPYTDALLSFKSEIDDSFNSLHDWLVPPGGKNSSGKVHACSWSGVRCNKNSTLILGLDLSEKNLASELSGKQFSVFTQLVDLNLSYNSFSGKLPAGIFNITSLENLDISRNNFSGHFPGGISGLSNLLVLDGFSNSFSGPLPAEVSQLQHLQVLNLAGSYFSGPIPAEYGSFVAIKFLHLAGNSLSGKLPPELGKLKTVTHMEIGYNSYEGSIPWQLGNMSELQYLDIAGASLSGPIPTQLSNLTKLQSLFLFRNQLTGLLPWDFSKIESLTSLDLSDNQISGPIPDSFSELKNLRLLSLMYNEMNGTVPEAIAELPSLETLFTWNNFFSGSLPENLGRNSKLRWLDVSTNNLVGSIPAGICAGGVLAKLILFSNNLSGSLSPFISNCSSLVRLRLEDNSFSGGISLHFNQFPDITYVDLSSNKLSGGIPADISEASSLQYFNVSNNEELGGIVPPETWSLPQLQNFSAASCGLSGDLPPFKSCKFICAVELHQNNLSGKVPVSVSNCQKLAKINLAGNKLIGHVPLELASLPALQVVDLSHNDFSGPIPAEFGKSSALELLNVSFNHISGSIPSEPKLQSMGRSSYTGNLELCGAPLGPCHSSMVILGSRGPEKLKWVILLCATVVTLVAGSVLWLIYIHRGRRGQWKMVSFAGLPCFTANDVLKSFNTTAKLDAAPPLSTAVSKVLLPTGITVLVKTVEWEPNEIKAGLEFINQLGNCRHKNLIRLLGSCYNNRLAYLLYDYLPNGNLAEKLEMQSEWAAKYRIVIGIAKGLCFLHHDCYPPLPHGDLKSSNIVFDDYMEPHLADYGLKRLTQLTKGSAPVVIRRRNTAWSTDTTKEELSMDIYSFGVIVLEILTNGRLTNAGAITESLPTDVLLKDICNESEGSCSSPSYGEKIKQVLDVALACTRSTAFNRPSMEEVLKLLSGPKMQSK